MKTKAFLLATSGATVDGRTIDAKMLEEMASSYDPKTYGARLNIEHIRGISGEGPFRAFGDVLECSTGEVEVDFNGKKEKRTGLFGVFDVTPDAKKLNEASQKVYPSIEIEPNFAGKGTAYLMGVALTDSPASVATERLQFNRQLPGALHLQGDEAALLEFPADADPAAQDGFLSKLGTLFDSFAAKMGAAPKADDKPQANPADPAQGAVFDFAQMKPLFDGLAQSFSAEVASIRTELRTEADALAVKLKKLEDEREVTPAPGFTARPQANGPHGNYARTDC